MNDANKGIPMTEAEIKFLEDRVFYLTFVNNALMNAARPALELLKNGGLSDAYMKGWNDGKEAACSAYDKAMKDQMENLKTRGQNYEQHQQRNTDGQ